jgi:hypothetical protein
MLVPIGASETPISSRSRDARQTDAAARRVSLGVALSGRDVHTCVHKLDATPRPRT